MQQNNGKKRTFQILITICVVLGVIRIAMFIQEYRERPVLPPGAAVAPAKPPPKPPKPPEPTEDKPEEKIENGLLIGRFTFKASLPFNETSAVGYLIPVDDAGKPLPGAADMIFYAPVGGEWRRTKPGAQPWLQRLARENSCSAFTLQISSDIDFTDERKIYYIYPEAGWFDVIFKMQRKIAKRFNLPERKLIITGISAGGSMAQNLIAAHPEKIDGAVWNGGSRYDMPSRKSDHIPRLMINTWGCPGEKPSAELTDQLRQRGVPALFTAIGADPELKLLNHHNPGPDYYFLMEKYIAGLIRLRRENNGKMPPLKEWKHRDGLDYFPDAEFAEVWRKRLTVQPPMDRSGLFGVYPHPGAGDRLAIVFTEKSNAENPLTLDLFYHLSRRGTVPVSINIGDDLLGGSVRGRRALAAVMGDERWKKLPVYVVGFGGAGQVAAIEAMRYSGREIKKITLFDTVYDSPFPDISIANHRASSRIPLRIYLNNIGEFAGRKIPDTEFLNASSSSLTNQSWHARCVATVEPETL